MASKSKQNSLMHCIGILLTLAVTGFGFPTRAQAGPATVSQGTLDIVSSTGENGNPFTGIYINALVCSNRFSHQDGLWVNLLI